MHKFRLDKRKDNMNVTKITFQIVFGDVLGKEAFQAEQITKLNEFLAKMV